MKVPASQPVSHQAAFAKVNLGLRVLDRRPDGYHNVLTLMQAIDFHDDVLVSVDWHGGPQVELECNRKDLEHEENLAWRAANALLRHLGLTATVRIGLRKRIPVGSGLGGGSSDAAAVLRGLADLLPQPVSPMEMCTIATGLGSDVPYFLVGGTAVATGRGTEVSALEDLPVAALVLVLPAIEVSTAKAYADLAASRAGSLTPHAGTPTMGGSGSHQPPRLAGLPDGLSDWIHNDFEGVVFRQFPALAGVKTNLLAGGARHALMSGSGSAVFGIFDSVSTAGQVAVDLVEAGLRVRVSRFLTRAECGISQQGWKQS